MTDSKETESNPDRKDLGNKGEELAAQCLLKKGFQILERNYRTREGEIDIIARQGKITVFVEVKTDRTGGFGPPETWVTPQKQRKIIKMALRYLQSKNLLPTDLRFDVIGVNFRENKPKIEHIEGAFWAPGFM